MSYIVQPEYIIVLKYERKQRKYLLTILIIGDQIYAMKWFKKNRVSIIEV